jgi:integral membrane protein
VKAALLRYRVAAYVVGLLLLGLVGAMYMKYAEDDDGYMWIAMIHGWFYLVYLGLAFDLYRRAEWPGKVMAGMIAGGLVPGMVFFVERTVSRRGLPPARPAKPTAPVGKAAPATKVDASTAPATSPDVKNEAGES